MSELNRREFVAAGAATVALCVLGVESIEAAAPPAGKIDVGTLDDYPANGISDKFLKPHKLFIVRNADQIFALNAVCTHKACVVAHKENALKCRCHGSEFTEHGTVANGPAKVSLFRYAIKLDAKTQRLIVDKKKQFAERQWTDPNSFIKVS